MKSALTTGAEIAWRRCELDAARVPALTIDLSRSARSASVHGPGLDEQRRRLKDPRRGQDAEQR